MNKFFLIIFCYFFLTHVKIFKMLKKIKKKNTNKEFTISIEPNLKTNK